MLESKARLGKEKETTETSFFLYRCEVYDVSLLETLQTEMTYKKETQVVMCYSHILTCALTRVRFISQV